MSSSYYQQFRDYTGHIDWMDADFLTSYRKHNSYGKHNNKTRKDLVYPMSSFVSAARISMMKEKEAAIYMEQLKGKVCTLSFPLSHSHSVQKGVHQSYKGEILTGAFPTASSITSWPMASSKGGESVLW